MTQPLNVVVTGAAGQIGYALLFRLAAGDCFGAGQPVRLKLLEIPPALKALEGVVMELEDGAFPLLHGVDITDDAKKAFDGAQQAFLVGSRPRGKGMDRADLIKVNGPIFTGQGAAINERAAEDVRVVVVGNPCNTNCLIAMHAAPDVPRDRFTAMTRLDENRARAQIARKAGVTAGAVTNLAVWGNHSDTMFPDWFHARAEGKPVTERIGEAWFTSEFLPSVAGRGKAVIEARGASSAASAANAAIDHMRAWWSGTPEGDWTSMAVRSPGAYGAPEGLVYSFPVRIRDGKWAIVEGLEHGDFARGRLRATAEELEREREAIKDLLK